jgi:chromate transporter
MDGQDNVSESRSDSLRVSNRGSPVEVLGAFLALGLVSFGGPAAHIGYFRQEFVDQRKWLNDSDYADLVALSQFLPGPGSSKLGFSLGLLRAGYLGGLAAWLGFTLPSAILLILFAMGAGTLSDHVVGQAMIHGLKLVAVAIVAHAIWGMARTLCPDRQRAGIAVAGATVTLLAPASFAQLAAIVMGAVLGTLLCRRATGSISRPMMIPVHRSVGIGAAVLFILLLATTFVAIDQDAVALFNAFYRSGALVFGGGHVVLPLLDQAVVRPGWITEEYFLAGYGAAQAVPGPLFAIGAYLGFAPTNPVGGWGGATVAVVAIFLPGVLLQLAALPFWGAFQSISTVQALMRGVNACVVGILGAALYSPVWTSAVVSKADFAVVILGFVMLIAWNAPPIMVVAVTAFAGAGLTLL